jgi:hypothetical protein
MNLEVVEQGNIIRILMIYKKNSPINILVIGGLSLTK